MLYVESRKSFEGKREKIVQALARANKKTLGKIITLPSAITKHSANNVFAECHYRTLGKVLTAGRSSWRPLHGRRTCWYFAECLMFAECFFIICRVFTLRHSQTGFLPSAICLPDVSTMALGTQQVCRVPDGINSANPQALGIPTVSGSVCMRASSIAVCG